MADRAFTDARLHRHVAIEITDVTAGADFVRHGLGIALLPRGVVGPHDDLTTLPITGAELDWSISLAIPDNRTPSTAARAFEQFVDRHLD
ncbi:LysR substrate-binding domain-containing protein [Streptomyces sp. NPDC059474]|uniref:LysR substrate-binding domain-containing protein n=1 Tax=Streptomyces sp. NPDC059474 TaxID=3346846 RepID=UPI0036D1E0D4